MLLAGLEWVGLGLEAWGERSSKRQSNQTLSGWPRGQLATPSTTNSRLAR